MSNYTKNQLIDDPNNSWSIIFDLIGTNKTVLDIGCSSGNFGAQLTNKKKCVVDGIDVDAADITRARKKLRSAYVLNIEENPLDMLDQKYDVILMMDVIEHLVNPAASLKKVAKLLKTNGRLIVSVPNMAHISVRLDLLSGNFQYRQTGLLDYTHLHFYTEDTLLQTLKSAGFFLESTASTTVSYPEELLEGKLKEAGLMSLPTFNKKLRDTKGNVYQLIGVAKLIGGKPKKMYFPATNPHEVHFSQFEKSIRNHYDSELKRLNKEVALKDTHIRNLETSLKNIQSSRSYKIANRTMASIGKINKKVRPDNKGSSRRIP